MTEEFGNGHNAWVWDAVLKPEAARALAVVLIAGHNLAQNSIFNEKGYVRANAVVTAALIGLGASSGSTLADMGLKPHLTRHDWRVASTAAAACALTTALAVSHPVSRSLFHDERARGDGTKAILQKVTLRFPLGTALFEEIAFRGVLPRVLARSTTAGDLLSSMLFALWHVIPTARVLHGSPLGRSANDPKHVIAAGSIAAGLAGLLLANERRRSGSIASPWMLHSIFNIITYLGGVVAWRIDGIERTPIANRRPK